MGGGAPFISHTGARVFSALSAPQLIASMRGPVCPYRQATWNSGALVLHHIITSDEGKRGSAKGSPPEGQNTMAEQGACGSGSVWWLCVSFLWLLLSVGSQGRNPNPAGTLIPCLTLGPVWVTGWLYGDEVGHVRAVRVRIRGRVTRWDPKGNGYFMAWYDN